MWKICQEGRGKSKVMRPDNKWLAREVMARKLAVLFSGPDILNL
jgi:hypothetical protein